MVNDLKFQKKGKKIYKVDFQRQQESGKNRNETALSYLELAEVYMLTDVFTDKQLR